MHDLDPTFRAFSRSPKVAALLASLGGASRKSDAIVNVFLTRPLLSTSLQSRSSGCENRERATVWSVEVPILDFTGLGLKPPS